MQILLLACGIGVGRETSPRSPFRGASAKPTAGVRRASLFPDVAHGLVSHRVSPSVTAGLNAS